MLIEKEKPAKTDIFKKIGKRNLIIAGAVLLIGAAVWLNWAIFAGADDGYGKYSDAAGMTDGTGAENSNGASENVDTYFTTAQTSRARARDEALEVLNSVVENENADETVKAQALSDIDKLALEMATESNIETLIRAKGFEECIAVINGDSATIVVKTEGETLLASEISQINEIVYAQAKILPVNINISKR